MEGNLAAEELKRKQMSYILVLRDIRMHKNRRYNQNLHPNSLILEIEVI